MKLEIKESPPFPDYYKDVSSVPCAVCKGPMTRGMEECIGICDKCYDEFNSTVSDLCRKEN